MLFRVTFSLHIFLGNTRNHFFSLWDFNVMNLRATVPLQDFLGLGIQKQTHSKTKFDHVWKLDFFASTVLMVLIRSETAVSRNGL